MSQLRQCALLLADERLRQARKRVRLGVRALEELRVFPPASIDPAGAQAGALGAVDIPRVDREKYAAVERDAAFARGMPVGVGRRLPASNLVDREVALHEVAELGPIEQLGGI